jgi:hypothetical protein
VLLFEGPYLRGEFHQPPTYDVAPDGRFLMLKWPDGQSPATHPLVATWNWVAEFERARGR